MADNCYLLLKFSALILVVRLPRIKMILKENTNLRNNGCTIRIFSCCNFDGCDEVFLRLCAKSRSGAGNLWGWQACLDFRAWNLVQRQCKPLCLFREGWRNHRNNHNCNWWSLPVLPSKQVPCPKSREGDRIGRGNAVVESFQFGDVLKQMIEVEIF